MKKKIFIWMHSMHLGGAERALIGLLQSIDYSLIEVDLFLNRHEGELLQDIPCKVNLLPEIKKYTCLAEPIQRTLVKREFLMIASRLFGKLLTFVKNSRKKDAGVSTDYAYKFTKWLLPKISKNDYDLAISFITPHYIINEKVKANKKIAWIHTDYSNIALDIKSQLNMWQPYDHIIAVSDDVKNVFENIFPSLRNKVCIIENILLKNKVIEQAEELITGMDNNSIKLLSIGRFAFQKNFENIPNICSTLIKSGFNVKWYIIGYGSYQNKIIESINKENMQDHVFILGKKENPYPYIKECDFYVQPSRYEGKAVTVREAQMLGKPVIITDFPTSQSQLENGVDGIIVPMDNENCAKGIINLLQDHALQETLITNCINNDYTNSTEIQKIYNFLNLHSK